MKATVSFVSEAFDRFNRICFDGSLPKVPIKLSNARTYLGKLTFKCKRGLFGRITGYENYTLKFSTAFDLKQEQLEDVVIHELIHYYITVHRITDSSVHGDIFRRMMNSINDEYGRHITISHRLEKDEIVQKEQVIRRNYICVTQLQNGMWGVTVSANNRIFEINRYLPEYYKLHSMKWFCSSDMFFNRFPRSRTPKIYKISESDLDIHLARAVPMKCKGHSIFPDDSEL